MKPKSPKQLERMLNTLLAKTMHGAKNDVAKVFQEMIRLEYAAAHNGWLDCVTCDYRAHWTETNTFDAGHFIQARRSSVIFAEDPTPNCHPQCKRCNKKDDLNNRDVPAKYHDYMVSRYGKPAVESLEDLGRQTKQFTKRELLELKLHFMARIETAKEQLRNL